MAAVALEPDAQRGGERAALCEALAHVRTGAVAPAARDDAQGRFGRGEAVGFVGEEVHAWGDPAQTLGAVIEQLRAGRRADQLPRGRGRAAGAPRRSKRWPTAASSSSCATAGSARTGGCWPPSDPRGRCAADADHDQRA